jgi:hypothetical protein
LGVLSNENMEKTSSNVGELTSFMCEVTSVNETTRTVTVLIDYALRAQGNKQTIAGYPRMYADHDKRCYTRVASQAQEKGCTVIQLHMPEEQPFFPLDSYILPLRLMIESEPERIVPLTLAPELLIPKDKEEEAIATYTPHVLQQASVKSRVLRETAAADPVKDKAIVQSACSAPEWEVVPYSLLQLTRETSISLSTEQPCGILLTIGLKRRIGRHIVRGVVPMFLYIWTYLASCIVAYKHLPRTQAYLAELLLIVLTSGVLIPMIVSYRTRHYTNLVDLYMFLCNGVLFFHTHALLWEFSEYIHTYDSLALWTIFTISSVVALSEVHSHASWTRVWKRMQAPVDKLNHQITFRN